MRQEIMIITISFPEIEKALTDAAVELGKTPDELAEQALRNQYVTPAEKLN